MTTATHWSNGCTFDITIRANLGGFYSDDFLYVVNTPWKFSTGSGPSDAPWGGGLVGYVTSYTYQLLDLCGGAVPGMAVNESFVSFADDYVGNTWGNPTPNSMMDGLSDSYFTDNVGAADQTTPPSTEPQNPRSTTKVKHIGQEWKAGSLTTGQGMRFQSDTIQHYVDHGRHENVSSPSPPVP
jgi:hypothetical protein